MSDPKEKPKKEEEWDDEEDTEETIPMRPPPVHPGRVVVPPGQDPDDPDFKP